MNDNGKSVKSADRVLDLLELLSMRMEPQRLNEISATLGYPKSSAHGLLTTLVNRGYVEKTTDDRYRLVAKLRDSFSWIGGFDVILRRQALPIMEKARDLTTETVIFARRGENFGAYTLARLISPLPIRYDSAPGVVPAAYSSVMGRVFLAHAPEAEVDAYFATAELTPYTDKTICNEAQLRAILREIRARGYGTIVDEYVIGGSAVCAPVRDGTGEVVAVLNIATVTQRYELRKDQMLDCVLTCAAELSERLGYTKNTTQGEV